MNKEQLQVRIKELEQGRDQARANLLAHEGAIQELTSWLNKPDEKKED
jgi:hypothetical protein